MEGWKKLFRRRQPPPAPARCAAVIVAAGKATRMEGIDKVLTPMGGEPLLLYTLAPFQASDRIEEIILVTREDLLVPLGTLCSQRGLTKVRRLVQGGQTRTESVLAGVEAVTPGVGLVAVHDGARPFLPPEVLEQAVETAETLGAAAPAIPVKDTIKVAQNGVVTETPDRAALFAVQTPQVFDADLLKGALQSALEQGAAITDDCSAVERLGKVVFLVEGEEENLKITTPVDMILAEAILAARKEGR